MRSTAKHLFELWGAASSTPSKLAPEHDPETEILREAVEKVGARVYRLINHKKSSFRICVFGCQGEEGSAQREVAQFINKLAQSPDTKPDLLLILGDNFYDDGVESATDPRFESQFYQIYYGEETPALHSVPASVVINHDGSGTAGKMATNGANHDHGQRRKFAKSCTRASCGRINNGGKNEIL